MPALRAGECLDEHAERSTEDGAMPGDSHLLGCSGAGAPLSRDALRRVWHGDFSPPGLFHSINPPSTGMITRRQ